MAQCPDEDQLQEMSLRGSHWTIGMIKGMKHLSYEERVRELEFFSLKNARLQGDHIVAFHYLKRTNFLSWSVGMDKDDCFTLKEGRFRLYTQ